VENGVTYGLLVLWIATVGADRIDLLAGHGPLVLKPVLILSPLVLLASIRDHGPRFRTLPWPGDAAWFLLLLTTLLAILLASVTYAVDPGLAVRRWALLAVESYACLLVVLMLANRLDFRRVLLRGAQIGLILVIAFNVIQVIRWFSGSFGAVLEMGGVLDLTPSFYGHILPRPSGSSLDASRGGLLIVMYLFIIAGLAPRSRGRSVLLAAGVVMLIATLSRSAMLAAVVAGGLLAVRTPLRPSRALVGGVSAVAAALLAVLLFVPAARDFGGVVVDVVGGRLSMGEGSSREHFALIARGWEVATGSLRNLLLGIGFGNSFLELQDFYPGTKYANFHSLYVTLLVEAGLFSLVPVIVLLTVPLLRGGGLQPLIAGLVLFNVFYQAHVESAFWFILALAWVAPAALDAPARVPAASGEPGTHARHPHPSPA
jgi:hypothetical protein